MRIILIILVVFAVGAKAQTFSDNVILLFKDLQSTYPASKICVTKAKTKMNNTMSADMQYATALINLYTQECKINETDSFYKRLNAELRSGRPDTLWKRTEDLITQSLDLFGENPFPQLYRGCIHIFTFQPGKLYSFNQFVSTTLNYTFAWKKAQNDELLEGFYRVVFDIKDAKGVNIEAISEFATEKEVLLKSSSIFNVLHISTEYSNVGPIKIIELQYVKRTARSTLNVTEATFCGFNDVTSGFNDVTSGFNDVASGFNDVASGADCPTINLTVIFAATILLLM